MKGKKTLVDIFTIIGVVLLKFGKQREKNYHSQKSRYNAHCMTMNDSFQLATSYKSYLPLASYAAGVSTAGLMEIRCKNVGNPEIAKEIMKKKIAYLGKTFEESLPYLASI